MSVKRMRPGSGGSVATNRIEGLGLGTLVVDVEKLGSLVRASIDFERTILRRSAMRAGTVPRPARRSA